MIERITGRITGRESWARDLVEQAREKGKRLEEQRKKVEEFLLSISLLDYAASRGRNPTDYQLQGLHGFGSAKSYYEAQTAALVELDRERIEAKCEVVVGLSFDSITEEVWGTTERVKVGAMGTGLRPKTG